MEAQVARVWVPREHAIEGDLPAVCVITGRPADARMPITFDNLPDWVWALAPLGWPFVLAGLLGTERLAVQLPVVAEAVTTYRQRRTASWLLSIPGLLIAIGGLFATSAPVVSVGGTLLAAGLAVGAVATRSMVGGRPDETGLWVSLQRAHPEFVAAVEARGLTPQ